ncbi:MAG: class I SAM-dependent methyltransferase [Acidimicrobiales bacterium]|jgi:2-polyprenyl-3-methyl-5-hydroxy-6-metoxy-1,4-benzoquinol methylase|nr:class I SAM-dependent methyltransferase [Acidimicrobiales bacterium]
MATVEGTPVEAGSSRYHVEVDPSAANNAHAMSLRFVGFDRDVLEVGAGAGHVTAVLAERGNRVTAVDVDADALQGAARHAVAAHAGDLDVTPLDELVGANTFDAVLLGDVIEHVRDPVRVLRSARRVLRPGGSIVVSVPNVAHVDLRLHLFIGRWQYQPIGLLDATHLRFFTRTTLEEALAAAGLRISALERVFRPVFGSGLNVGPGDVAPEIVEELLLDPEAETFQFVVHAKREEDALDAAESEARLLEADELLLRARRRAEALEEQLGIVRERELELAVELDAVNADRDRLRAEAAEARERSAGLDAELGALRRLLPVRLTHALHRRYRRFRVTPR